MSSRRIAGAAGAVLIALLLPAQTHAAGPIAYRTFFQDPGVEILSLIHI